MIMILSLCRLIAERKLIGKYADIAQKILPNSYVTVLLWLRKFELKQITRGNQSKLTKGWPTLRYSAVAIAAGSRSAIPQMGRFEPSNKRCNNSAPVFQHPLFTFHPSFFLRPSPRASLSPSSHPLLLSLRSKSLQPLRETLCLQNKQESFARKSQGALQQLRSTAGGGDGGRGILITRILSVRVIIVLLDLEIGPINESCDIRS